MNYPKLDPINGRFLATPKGQKTPKMLFMEKELGVKFEDDYKNQYLSGRLGQKRFATRWSSSKGLIFANNLRGGRRSWVEMLELPRRDESAVAGLNKKVGPICECCGEKVPSLDGAHWVERANGGTAEPSNIAKLCPNCHRKLDRDDLKTTEDVRAALLYRVSKNILDNSGDKIKTKSELVEKVTPIIMHRRNMG